MDKRTADSIMDRLERLERESVRLRLGEVTDDAPLSVALGGSDVAYEGVKATGRALVSDIVAVLARGNDALVLGALGDGITTQGKKSIVPTEQSRTDTAYGYLGTEDKVTGIVVGTDDVIVVKYLALWKCSVAAAGRAALFIGANQLSRVDGNGAPAVQEVAVAVSQDTRYGTLATAGEGLIVPNTIVADETFVTTGLALANHQLGGGECHILKVAAGTYDIGVQFKATSGSVSAKERNLFVEVRHYDA